MGWKGNQGLAVTQPGNIIVTAGAGSGKTFTMIGRIIEKLKNAEEKDGKFYPNLGQMLIVTFTRASAADMRIKLTNALYALKADPRYKKTATSALIDLSTANIGTLHSFCQKVIKTYFAAAGIDSSFTMCDDTESEQLMLDAVGDAVTEAHKSGDKYFEAMCDMLESRDDGAITAHIKKILDIALSMTPENAKSYLNPVASDRQFDSELDGLLSGISTPLLAEIDVLTEELKDLPPLKKQAESIYGFKDYMFGKLDKIEKTRYTPKNSDGVELVTLCREKNEKYRALRTRCVNFRELYLNAQTAKGYDSAPYVSSLKAVAKRADELYAKYKRERGKIDYSDLEHGAYRALCNEDCMQKIAEQFKYVFIDEFQDVNPLQSAIANKFKERGAEMFVVGDVKQSIYGFRRCSPEHFIAAQNSPDFKCIPLSDNFRSSPAVIDFVNRLFDKVMKSDFGGVDYADPSQRMKCAGEGSEAGSAHFYLVDVDKSRRGGEFSEDGYSVVTNAATIAPDREAEIIADYILDTVKKDKTKKLSSIAVILRATDNAFCRRLQKVFSERSIKYVLEKKDSAKNIHEVALLTDIMRCADNRFDDIALYAAMRSPVGGFSDEELLKIAVEGGKAAEKRKEQKVFGNLGYEFWQKVANYDGELNGKIRAFFDARQTIADYAKTHSAAEVMGFITSRFGFFQYVYEIGGDAAAVQAYIDFAQSREFDMHALIDCYDTADIKLSAKGGGDAVNIMTIHKSKGLEFDTVIVANVGADFNERDRSQSITVNDRGVFVRIPDEDRGERIKSVRWLIEYVRYPDWARAEELRMLYVALTRAKKDLIVIGKGRNFKDRDRLSEIACYAEYFHAAGMHAEQPDFPHVAKVGEDEVPPVVPQVTDWVKKRIARLNELNAMRESAVTLSDGAHIPIKTSVTTVAHRDPAPFEGTAISPSVTVDDRDGGMRVFSGGGTNRGTAYHRVMEHIDFDNPDFEAAAEGVDGKEDVNEGEILKAVAVMRSLTAGASFVAKERYFIVNLPAKAVFGCGDGDVLVQGVIDLLVVDSAGNAVIVDYKTGNPDTLNNAAYRTQLALYTAAVEKCTPYKVKSAMLYSFEAGDFVHITERE